MTDSPVFSYSEITPEMIEAGVGILLCYHRERNNEDDVVREIFGRMWDQLPSSLR